MGTEVAVQRKVQRDLSSHHVRDGYNEGCGAPPMVQLFQIMETPGNVHIVMEHAGENAGPIGKVCHPLPPVDQGAKPHLKIADHADHEEAHGRPNNGTEPGLLAIPFCGLLASTPTPSLLALLLSWWPSSSGQEAESKPFQAVLSEQSSVSTKQGYGGTSGCTCDTRGKGRVTIGLHCLTWICCACQLKDKPWTPNQSGSNARRADTTQTNRQVTPPNEGKHAKPSGTKWLTQKHTAEMPAKPNSSQEDT
nr:uncharacterized protein LOC117794819 [Marmota flaviventris]